MNVAISGERKVIKKEAEKFLKEKISRNTAHVVCRKIRGVTETV